MALDTTKITAVAGTPDFYPPKSGTTVQSADVKALAQATADRFAMLATGVSKEHWDDSLVTAFATWTTSNVYADAGGGTFPITIDVPNLLVGDVLDITFAGVFLFTTTGAGPDLAMMRVTTIDDFGGAANVDALVDRIVVDREASKALNETVMLFGKHVVANAGTTRVKLQALSLNFANALVCKGYRIEAIPMRP